MLKIGYIKVTLYYNIVDASCNVINNLPTPADIF